MNRVFGPAHSLLFLALFFWSWFSLSRFAEGVTDLTQLAMYGIIVIFVVQSVLTAGSLSGGTIQAALLFSYFFFVSLFTAIGGIDFQALAALLGFLALFFVYFAFSTKWGESQFERVVEYLSGAAYIFIFLNLIFIFDDAAYSFSKSQFSGLFRNPNAFAAMAGFFLILRISTLVGRNHALIKLTVDLPVVTILAVLLFLSGSRSAIAITAFTSLFLFRLQLRSILQLAFMFFSVVFAYLLIDFGFIEVQFQRDLFEETGRSRLLEEYRILISENFPLGVGLSREGARIRSELSYLDILSFSGIGAVPFFIFIVICLYNALAGRNDATSRLASAIFLVPSRFVWAAVVVAW